MNPQPDKYILRDKIVSEMKKRKWSIYRLAKESETNWGALSYFLKGKKDLYGKSLESVLLALDFDVQALGQPTK